LGAEEALAAFVHFCKSQFGQRHVNDAKNDLLRSQGFGMCFQSLLRASHRALSTVYFKNIATSLHRCIAHVFALYFSPLPVEPAEQRRVGVVLAGFNGFSYGGDEYLTLDAGDVVHSVKAPCEGDGWAYAQLMDGTARRGWCPPTYVHWE
jgi:hypothetical protein